MVLLLTAGKKCDVFWSGVLFLPDWPIMRTTVYKILISVTEITERITGRLLYLKSVLLWSKIYCLLTTTGNAKLAANKINIRSLVFRIYIFSRHLDKIK
jgi:hypothetical protein